jgi:hypothetical protein
MFETDGVVDPDLELRLEFLLFQANSSTTYRVTKYKWLTQTGKTTDKLNIRL